MGMSASQARLLSLTTRINNNEFRAQTITNAKLRLADNTQEASAEYMEALNSQKLVYSYFDDNGETSYSALTANSIYTFSDIKNQYSLVNSAGKILIPDADIKKYVEASDMANYLYSYGVAKTDNPKLPEALIDIYGSEYANFFSVDEYKKYVSEYDKEALYNKLVGWTEDDISSFKSILEKSASELTLDDAAQINNAVAVWSSQITSMSSIIKTGGVERLKGSFGAYVTSLLNPPDIDFPDKDDDRFLDVEGNSELANKYDIASKKCYQHATPPYAGLGQDCFKHVLAHLLLKDSENFLNDSPTYSGRTTTGVDFTIGYMQIRGSAINGSGQTPIMVEVANEINKVDESGKPVYYAPKDISDTTTISSPEKDKLLSNYKWIGGEKVLKSWTERICDLYSAFERRDELGIDYESELLPYLDKFQTDMQTALSSSFNEDRYLKAVEDWKSSMLKWLESIQTSQKLYKYDLDNIPIPEIPDENDSKYQWYKNLWYRLGSTSETEKGDGRAYAKLDTNLLNNSEWLQLALEHGIVSIEKAQFAEQGSDKYTKMGTYDWVSTIYTNAGEWVYKEDEIAIAVAEVKYKKTVKEIEAKDKKYDQDLKKLDTEHTAMQTEYESIKEVMNKNVERSFKAYS